VRNHHENNTSFEAFEAYGDYEERLDPTHHDRQAHRTRKPKVKQKAKKVQDHIFAELADAASLETGSSTTTYQPSRHESGWLLNSLQDFITQEYITDVLGIVKGGKEANVYRCQGHPTSGHDLLAVKVYRPRQFRQLRNDKMYREGRHVITNTTRNMLVASGVEITSREEAMVRAMGKKTAFGVQVAQTSWLAYEYGTLQQLYALGAAVPQPVAASDNAILMSYVGDESMAAPLLNDVSLERDEAQELFNEVLRNLELMLANGMIHGDLSAYNILYWEGDITLIDFPQVTDSRGNNNAYFILQRDIERVCQYFQRQGVKTDSRGLMRDLWKRYVERDPNERAADLSRLEVKPEEA
jgi:RIO kinase 1